MHRFLELYQETGNPELPAQQFRALASDAVVDALLRADILERIAPAKRYGCEWAELGCFRRVIENRGDTAFPWVAICGLPRPACVDKHLREDQLEEYRLLPERFTLGLRNLMRLRGPFQVLDPSYLDTVHLGELDNGSRACDVLLSPAQSRPALALVLAERMLALRRSIVLAPTRSGVPLELVQRYPPGGHVALGFLSDLVAVRADKLVLLEAFEQLTRARTEPPAVFCDAYMHDGARVASRIEYDEIIQAESSFDLVVDATMPRARGGRFAVSRRHPDGVIEKAALSRKDVDALVELVRKRGVPMRAHDLAALKGSTPKSAIRVLERARSVADILMSSRYDWRAFPTIPGTGPSEQRYVFEPPPVLRYSVLALK